MHLINALEFPYEDLCTPLKFEIKLIKNSIIFALHKYAQTQ